MTKSELSTLTAAPESARRKGDVEGVISELVAVVEEGEEDEKEIWTFERNREAASLTQSQAVLS